MDVDIIEMSEFHLKFLKKFLDMYDEFWNADILEEEFLNGNSKYFVAVNDNKILGFAGLWFNIDEAHVMNIAVHKDFRKKSIGSKLLNFLIVVAKNENKTCITLEVREDNIAAIHLYKKMNFVEVGRRKKYYENMIDAIIMTMYY